MQTMVRFVLDGRIVEIDFSKQSVLKPTTTVLNYLRLQPGHKGVKEGCAEGDCGACTVVIAESTKEGKLIYESVDSCLLFLPMIHGKQLITVENLAVTTNGERILHPVQQQMVETNGSQCGYCTPGIVMSLFGLYKNHKSPEKTVILDALVGNLCRCTGYRSIIEAAQKASNPKQSDHFSENEHSILNLLQGILKEKKTLEIITTDQKYYKPFLLSEALRLKKTHPDAIVINGSTDIALRQTKRHEKLTEILDLSGVDELSYVTETPDHIVFGAGSSIEQVKNITVNSLPALNEMLSVFGSLQIRNMATIGGNICSASPIGDTLPLLVAYQSKVKLCSSSSERIINLDEFIKGYRLTDLKKDELLTAVIIPRPEKETVISSFKVSRRRDLDISTVSAAFRLKLKGQQITEILIVYGGMAEMTRRALKTEAYLNGKEWTLDNIIQAGKLLRKEFNPISDARAEAEYRSIIAENLLIKFYYQTFEKLTLKQ